MTAWAADLAILLGLVALGVVYLAGRKRRWTATTQRRALGVIAALLLAAAVAQALFAAEGSGNAAHRSPPVSRWDGVPLTGSWQLTSLTAQTNALLEAPGRGNAIWAGTTDGAWLSPDGGTTWRRAASGLGHDEILSLGTTPAGGEIVAGSGTGAVYLGALRRGGRWSWQRIMRPLGADHPIFCVALSPNGGHSALAGTFGAVYRGVRSREGWRWRRVARAGGNSGVTSIAWAPWDARLAYASIFGITPPVIVTRDGGATWHADTKGLPSSLPSQALVALATRPPQILLTTMGNGVWQQSARSGWHDISAGLPARHGMPLAVSRAGKRLLFYTGTMGFGVYGREGTAPWRRVGKGLNGGDHTVLGLAATSGPHAALLAGTALGVFRYTAR